MNFEREDFEKYVFELEDIQKKCYEMILRSKKLFEFEEIENNSMRFPMTCLTLKI